MSDHIVYGIWMVTLCTAQFLEVTSTSNSIHWRPY